MRRNTPEFDSTKRLASLRSSGDRASSNRATRRGKTLGTSRSSIAGAPGRLRLVGASAPDMRPPTTNPTPIRSATDPRWVLAVSTARVLEGDILPPVKRESLMAMGKSMGLTPFDCSLILAIVQDRARRGIAPDHCPAAGEAQLALIPLPPTRSFRSILGDRPAGVAVLAAGLLALQAFLIWVWLS
ncbi:MAG: hypothetical protein ACPGYV_00075 [Phycisphaeraceae bacterium]